MRTVNREASFVYLPGENCICLGGGKWTIKEKSTSGVCECVEGEHVTRVDGGFHCSAHSNGQQEFSKSVCMYVDTGNEECKTPSVCICVGEEKWICVPRECVAAKRLCVCVKAAKKEDSDDTKLCVAIGAECAGKCEAEYFTADGIDFCVEEEWICKRKEDSAVQDVCIYVCPGKCARKGDEKSICICVGSEKPSCLLSNRTSVSRLDPCVSIDIDEKSLEEVIATVKDWALMHGACMRSKVQFNPDVLQFAPFVLVPSTYPRKQFENAVDLQPLVNELVHLVSHNHEFLEKSLVGAITVDPFTAEMYKIYETVRAEGIAQPISLGMLRSDMMLSDAHPGADRSMPLSERYHLKQVEVNTIAAGFGWLGPASGHLQRIAMDELSHRDKLAQMPENRALECLAGGMLKAWELYQQSNAAILFIIEDVTYNICDQRFHEFEIHKQNPAVRVLRRTLTELGRGAGRFGAHKELIVDGIEIAVVYFRCGYSPDQYSSGDRCEWNARLLIERSKAIKCPSISYHLAGTKKVQQTLAQPGVLEGLLEDEEKAKALRQCFTGLYSLDLNPEGDQATEMAIKDPERFVLKPQREGGGNNVYGMEVKAVLEELRNSPERAAYILMDVIKPPLLRNWMIRPGSKPIFEDTVSELGIFGVIIGNSKEIFHNSAAGHMLRTKVHSANEGGVAAGLGALDSPFLVD